jgi:hypothetical protein
MDVVHKKQLAIATVTAVMHQRRLKQRPSLGVIAANSMPMHRLDLNTEQSMESAIF